LCQKSKNTSERCISIFYSNKDAFHRTNTAMGAAKKFHGNMPIASAKYNFDLSNASVTEDKVFACH